MSSPHLPFDEEPEGGGDRLSSPASQEGRSASDSPDERPSTAAMDEATFTAGLTQWQAMPGWVDQDAEGVTPPELEAKLEALCRLYLEAASDQRFHLVRLFSEPPPGEQQAPSARFGHLREYIGRLSKRITSASDVTPLYLGLAAAVLTRDYPDSREALMALGELHYSATQAGMDPTASFEEMFASAPPERQEFLQQFLQRDDVRRKQAIRIYGTPRRKVLLTSGSPRRVAEVARQEAQRLHSDSIATGHLLLGLLTFEVITDVLKELEVDPGAIRSAVEARLETESDPADRVGTGTEFNETPLRREVGSLAFRERLPVQPLGAERYLLALLRHGKNMASEVLRSFGVEYDQAREAVLKVIEEKAVILGDYDDAEA